MDTYHGSVLCEDEPQGGGRIPRRHKDKSEANGGKDGGRGGGREAGKGEDGGLCGEGRGGWAETEGWVEEGGCFHTHAQRVRGGPRWGVGPLGSHPRTPNERGGESGGNRGGDPEGGGAMMASTPSLSFPSRPPPWVHPEPRIT